KVSTLLNSKKRTKLNCEYHFGISKLNNASLLKHFFPEDLPEDWRFSYYSNEFDLLLIHLSDLNLSALLIQQENKLTGDIIIEQLSELIDDIDNSVFSIFDCSTLSQVIQQQIFESRIATENNCHFINADEWSENQIISHSIQIEWCNVLVKRDIEQMPGRNLFCAVKSEKKIEPAELKTLIEHIRDYALKKEGRMVSIVFSSNYALENCRNAILLESMM
ncbi:MAG: hypothetical protein DRQ43_06120, partial [Gammaproteobacteria bacterium]